MIIFLAFCSCLKCQDLSFNIQSIKYEQGLDARFVPDVNVDSLGLLWIGTPYRLHRYDGYKLENYKSKNSFNTGYSLQYSETDSDGLFWYVYKYDDSNIKRKSRIISNNTIRTILPDLDIEIFNPYSGTYENLQEKVSELDWNEKKIIRFNKNNDQTLTVLFDDNTYLKYKSSDKWLIDTIPTKSQCLEIKFTSDNKILALTEDGIVRLDSSFNIISKIPTQTNLRIQEFDVDDENRIWILYWGPESLKVGLVNNRNELKILSDLEYNLRRVIRLNSLSVSRINETSHAIKVLRQGYILSNNKFNNINDYLNENTFIPISNIKTAKGKLFIGSDNGAYIMSPRNNYFNTLFQGDSVLNSCRGIIKNDKFFYLNSYTGVRFSIDDSNYSNLEVHLPALYGKTAFYDSLTGNIFSTRHSYKQFVFNPHTKSIQHFELPVRNNNADQILRSEITGKLLSLGNSGIFEITSENKVIPFNPLHKFLSNKYIRNGRMFEIDSSLWLVNNLNLISFNYNTSAIKTHFLRKGSRDIKGFNYIYPEGDSIYWLATYNSGLVKWNHILNEYDIISVEVGLSDNHIYSIYKDNYNRFWLPTNNGLNCYNPVTKDIYSFMDSDGIAHNEFNRYSDYQDAHGLLFFGGLNGITYFNPDSIHFEKNLLADLIVLNISTLNEKGEVRKLNYYQKTRVKLNREEKGLKIVFTTNDLNNSNSTIYYYKINGYINEWQSQYANEIILPAIPPGKHILEIRFKKPGILNIKKSLVIPIFVPKPFHQTILFYSFLLTGFALIIWTYIQIRTRYLLRQAKKLTEMVESKTIELKNANTKKDKLFWLLAHDLKSPINSLNNMNQKLSYLLSINEIERAFSLSEKVDKTVESLNDNLNNIIQWALKDQNLIPYEPGDLELRQYANNTINLYLELCSEKNITIKNKLNQIDKVFMDKTALQTILRNILHNAIKYSPVNSLIQLYFKKDNENYGVLSISDKGPGMSYQDESKKGFGLGLIIVEELIKINYGELSIESDSNGTIVHLKMPLSKLNNS